MEYLVLRDCFKKDVYYRQGEIKDLPEDMVGSSIHFRRVDEPMPDAPESITEPIKEETNNLACSDCGKECKSEFGLKSHKRVHK